MPQQDAARNAGVQAFHPAGHGDAHSAAAGGNGLFRQALALAADDYADTARVAGPGRAQGLALVECRRKAGDVLCPQGGNGGRHCPHLHHRHPHGGPHGGPQGLGGKHAGTAIAQQHAVKAERGGRAQQRAHVAGVLHPLKCQIPPAGLCLVQRVHRGAEDAEHALMSAHIGQLIGHMVLHQIVLPGQPGQLRALFQRCLGAEQGLQRSAAAELRAELAALGQKFPLTAPERPAGSKAAGIFDLCVFPAGDLFHAVLQKIQKYTKRTPAYFTTRGRLSGLYQAFFTVSTRAAKL